MKVKIKTYNGALPSYFTLGKEYIVVDDMHESAVIRDDKLNEVDIMFFNCPHLNGGLWEVVE